MRRLARLLFTLCSAVSLVLCLAVCVLWVRSYWIEDVFTRVSRPSPEAMLDVRLTSAAGRLAVNGRLTSVRVVGRQAADGVPAKYQHFAVERGTIRFNVRSALQRHGFNAHAITSQYGVPVPRTGPSCCSRSHPCNSGAGLVGGEHVAAASY